jgi:hypothetical protein
MEIVKAESNKQKDLDFKNNLEEISQMFMEKNDLETGVSKSVDSNRKKDRRK